jgi:hypothetical protein
MAKYNAAMDAAVSDYTNQLVNQRNYNTMFRGASPYQTDMSNVSSSPITDPLGQAYSTAGNTDTTGVSQPGAASDQPAPDTGGGFFSGLRDWISAPDASGTEGL